MYGQDVTDPKLVARDLRRGLSSAMQYNNTLLNSMVFPKQPQVVPATNNLFKVPCTYPPQLFYDSRPARSFERPRPDKEMAQRQQPTLPLRGNVAKHRIRNM